MREGKLLGTAEKKILAIFVAYIIFGVYTLVYVSIVTANSHKFGEALTAYFKCKLSGDVPHKCDRSEFEQYKYPYVSSISFILIGLLPISILNYVLKFEIVKKLLLSRLVSLGKRLIQVCK